MKSRGKRYRLLFFFLLSVAGLLGGCKNSANPETDRSRVSVSIRYGFEQKALYQCHIPVTVRLKNHGPDFRGRVRLEIAYNGQDRVMYEKKASAVAGGQAETDFLLHLNGFENEMTASVVNDGGREIGQGEVKISYGNRGSLYVGVLSESFGSLSSLNGKGRKLMPLSAKEIPESSLGLEALDVLLISDFDTSALNERQCDAIGLWVRQGGSVVFDTSGGITGEGGAALEARLFRGKSNALRTAGGDCVIRDAGSGNIQYADCRPDAFLDEASPDLKDPGGIIFSRISELKKQQKDTEQYSISDEDLEGSMKEAIWAGDPVKLPSAGTYFLMAALYLLLAGPVLYVLLKRKDRRNLYWLLVPALAVLFSVLIFILGSDTRREKPFARYVNYLLLPGDRMETAVQETWFSVMTPGKRGVRLELNKDFAVTPVNNGDDADTERASDYRIGIREGGAFSMLELHDSAAFRPICFLAEKQAEANGLYYQKLAMEDFRLTGTLENRTGINLTNAVVKAGNSLTKVGDIPDGKSITIDGTNAMLFSSHWDIYGKEAARFLRGGEKGEEDQESYFYALWSRLKQQRLPEEDSFLIGLAEETAMEPVLGKMTGDLKGLSLVVMPLDIPYYFKGKEAVPDILSYRHTVEEGYGLDTNNRYMPEETLTVTYSFGNDVIEGLYYLAEWNRECRPEEKPKPLDSGEFFSGTVYAYNQKEDIYVPLFTGGSPGEEKDLSDYLSAGNELTLRFTTDSADLQKELIGVPVISAVGRIEGE